MTERSRIPVFKDIKSFTTVAANGLNVIDLPLGKTYTEFIIELTGCTWAQAESEIAEIALIADGKYIRRLNPEQISHLRTWHGDKIDKADVATVIVIPAVPEYLIDPNSQDAFLIGTNVLDANGNQRPLTNFTLQITMGATVTNITAGKVAARFMDYPSLLGPYYKVDGLSITDASAVTGIMTIDRITTRQKDVGLIGVHIELPGSSAITNVTVEDDTGEIYNNVSKTVLDTLALQQGFTQGADYVGIPIGLRQLTGKEFLEKTMANLLIKPTFATAAPNTFKIITEELVFRSQPI